MKSRNASLLAQASLALACLSAAAPAAAQARAARTPEIELRLAELHPADHPTARADFEFARLVGERSGGRIRVSVYTDSVLGQEVAVLEQLQFGAIDIARVSAAAVAVYVPRLRALQMPYLYRDDEQMWRILKGQIGRELLSSVSEAGFVGLGWFEAGARCFYSARKPIRTPSDLRGMRIRVQEGSVMAEAVAALGANASPMAFGEVYSLIQTGGMDGAENNASTYWTSEHYKIAPYYTLTEHVRIPEIIVGSSSGLASLSASDRELIARAAMDAIEFQREAWAEYETAARSRAAEAGVEIIGIPDLAAWKAAFRPVYDRQDPEIRALIARIRAAD